MSNLLKVVVLLGMCSSYFHECLAVPLLTGGQACHKRCQESARHVKDAADSGQGCPDLQGTQFLYGNFSVFIPQPFPSVLCPMTGEVCVAQNNIYPHVSKKRKKGEKNLVLGQGCLQQRGRGTGDGRSVGLALLF